MSENLNQDVDQCYINNVGYSYKFPHSIGDSEMFNKPPPPYFQNFHQTPVPPFPVPPLPFMSTSHQTQSVVSGQQMQLISDQNYYRNDFMLNNQVLSSEPHHQFYSLPLNIEPIVSASSYQDLNINLIHVKSEENHVWLKNWINTVKHRMNLKDDYRSKCGSSSLSTHKINDVKQKVVNITKLLAELENSSKSLFVTYKSLNDCDWALRCKEIKSKKNSLTELVESLKSNNELVPSIKFKLSKRKKKRIYQKRKREEWKEQKNENRVRVQQLHKSIDRKLNDMKDSIERIKRDEELKKQADCVLADVTHKKTEAKRQISLLSALLKLRESRITAQKAIGKNISQIQTDAFNNVIERLKSLWNEQLREYSIEEQGLKLMLNEAAAEEKNNEDLRKRGIFREWDIAIFGNSGRQKNCRNYQPSNINEFVSVRKQWDQFVVDDNCIMSSTIPPGWVLPTKGCNSDWNKFNKTA